MVIIQAFVAKALARSKKLGSNFLNIYIYMWLQSSCSLHVKFEVEQKVGRWSSLKNNWADLFQNSEWYVGYSLHTRFRLHKFFFCILIFYVPASCAYIHANTRGDSFFRLHWVILNTVLAMPKQSRGWSNYQMHKLPVFDDHSGQ